MSTWVTVLIVFGVILVWVFCAARVLTIARARHKVNCFKPKIDECAHMSMIMLGWIAGPFMYITVIVYQLADGTYLALSRARKRDNMQMLSDKL